MDRLFKKISKNNFLKELSFKAAYFPLLRGIYRKIYQGRINKRVSNFKLSDLMVSIEPSNTCNARCVMCPYSKMTRPKTVMPMELFKKIVDDCHEEGVSNFNLNFYNEPFLDPFIFDRIKYLKSKGIKVKLFSNGSVVDKEKANKTLESGLDEINFSLDSCDKETYESIRKGLNFETVVKNVSYLFEEKKRRKLLIPVIKAIFVRQKINKKEAGRYENFWKNKVDKIVFSFDDNRNETSEFFIGKNKKLTPFPCKKLWTEINVMSNGKVALCCIDSDGKELLGDFNSQSLREIWNNEKFKEIRKKHLDFEADAILLCKLCAHPYRMNVKSWWQ